MKDSNAQPEPRKFSKTISDAHIKQINVLRAMTASATMPNNNLKQFHINEIAKLSGLADIKEIQRYLYILEGQKLVQPNPEGDFTSNIWCATKRGVKVMKTIINSITQ